MTIELDREACASYLCAPETPIRTVLARLDATRGVGQVVVDAGGKLVGVVTDGDLRRALLDRAELSSPVSGAMNPRPIVGRAGQISSNRSLLWTTPTRRAFLPIVDGEGYFVALLLDDASVSQQAPIALVMAGGYGKRLGAKTANKPKPLLEVGGVPILEHVLRGLERGGIRRVFLATHFLADQIEAFANARDGTTRLSILHEERPLGTAGAVGLLPTDSEGPVIVMNADLMTEADIGQLVEFWHCNGLDGVVAVTTHELSIDFGVVRHDEQGLFAGIDEKPKLRHFVAAGLYLLGSKARALVQPPERLDMPELLNRARTAGLRIGLFPLHEYWRDVGRPDDLAAARLEHVRQR